MIALRLCYLLIGLLVFQTALASHEAEQVSEPAEQIQGQYTDYSAADRVDLPVEPQDGGKDSYQQCCDCYCCGIAGLFGQPSQPLIYGGTGFQVFSYFSVPAEFYTALYRPPIARV